MYSFCESLKEIVESFGVFLDRGKLTSLAVKLVLDWSAVTQADDVSHDAGLFQALPLVDCQVFTNKAMWHCLLLITCSLVMPLCFIYSFKYV